MGKKYRIAVIPGDGIGPEITEAAIYALNHVGLNFEFIRVEAGLGAWQKYGNQLPEETVSVIKSSDACLKGPTQTPPGPGTFKSATVTLRQMLDLYANVRPFKNHPGVQSVHKGVDLIIVRENTEGMYRGLEYNLGDSAIGIRTITRRGSERIARFAFNLARREKRRKVTAVHKANVLKETCGLFRNVCAEIAKEYPDIVFEEMHVDAAAMRIAMKPQDLDVIVTTNLFGDILSDEAAGVVGGLGIAPSANIGDKYAFFEAIHGTAPKHAGKWDANPAAIMLSAAMMLRYLGEVDAGNRFEAAIDAVLEEGKSVTRDLGGSAGTMDFAKAVADKLTKIP
ncbi:MAG: NAD-dependent isocitrate dehydrogenase [Candidatus Methanomethylicota archaeon]|uniref:NAD-dependent isocitrate dehydrogenase n=1 Tax=Thermoproteota archaeon TaxID=2056631 RepID=A0A523BD67_9CREN|nr:MAG: NAD-dependent isocitrate dehydrogenase [Candidatus Verstraetearchaeota archaeon]